MDNNIFGQTDIGRVRDNNEDAFLADELMHSEYILGCVIDGVGGYEGGEVAASITKECIKKHLYSITEDDLIPRMVAALKIANEEIFNHKQQDPSLEKMACVLTLVLADVKNNKFYYAHVGDTRLYLLRDGALVKITTDHSFVGFLEDSGRLTESAAMSHPKRNEINQALGFNSTASLKEDFIETGESPFLPGDTLLLCSDGLTDRIDKDQMTAILTQHASLKVATSVLVDAANEAGGHDNITVVLMRNNTEPLSHQIAKPIAKVAEVKQEREIAPIQTLTKPSTTQVKGKRGWITFLLAVILILLGLVTWMYIQIVELRKHERQLVPIQEKPWEPIPANPQDTIPVSDSTKVIKADSVVKKTEVNGKRTAQ